MTCVKKLYGKTVIDSSESDELQEDFKIELEYYQIENKASEKPYGIEIVKKNMIQDKEDIEEKIIENICNEEQGTSELLDIFISNKVTPISVEDIMSDLAKVKVI